MTELDLILRVKSRVFSEDWGYKRATTTSELSYFYIDTASKPLSSNTIAYC